MWNTHTWARCEKESSRISHVHCDESRLSSYPLRGLNVGDEIFVINYDNASVRVGGRMIVGQKGLTKSEVIELKDAAGAPLVSRIFGEPTNRYVSADPRYLTDFQSRTLSAEQSRELWGINANSEHVQLVDSQPGQRLRTPWKLTPESASLLRALLGEHGASEDYLDSLIAEAESSSKLTEADRSLRRTLRSVLDRRGQPEFRRKLLAAYGGKCCVTGSMVEDVLEAAHIVPYATSGDNDTANGLLLRSDIHTLFDLGLLDVRSDYLINLHDALLASEYNNLQALFIKLPADPQHLPSKERLSQRMLRRSK